MSLRAEPRVCWACPSQPRYSSLSKSWLANSHSLSLRSITLPCNPACSVVGGQVFAFAAIALSQAVGGIATPLWAPHFHPANGLRRMVAGARILTAPCSPLSTTEQSARRCCTIQAFLLWAARCSSHCSNERWLSPDGFPNTKFSTPISSSRSGQ